MTSWHLPHCSPGWPPLCSLRRCRCWAGHPRGAKERVAPPRPRDAVPSVWSPPPTLRTVTRCSPAARLPVPHWVALAVTLVPMGIAPSALKAPRVRPPPHPRAATQPRACARLLGPPRRGGRDEATGSPPRTDSSASDRRVLGGGARVSILTFCRGFLPRLGAMAPSSHSQWSQHASEVASGSATDSGSWCRRRALHP